MRHAKAIPVLMYHHVSPVNGLVTVSPEVFESHMRWLAENGWHSITCDDFARFIAGEPLPSKSVLITFDDGYLDNWVYAHPVLQRYGLQAALFIITGWIGDGVIRPHAGSGLSLPATPSHRECKLAVSQERADDVMMRWSEVEAARQAGTFEFHSHTHTHARWDKLCANREEKRNRLDIDLTASRDTLLSRLGVVSDHLCWPQGYFDDDYLAVAKSAGFRHLYTTQKGVNTVGMPVNNIKRLVIKDKDSSWFGSRVRWFSRPVLGHLYAKVSG